MTGEGRPGLKEAGQWRDAVLEHEGKQPFQQYIPELLQWDTYGAGGSDMTWRLVVVRSLFLPGLNALFLCARH